MTNIQSIQRVSRFMQGVCVAVIGALPLLWLWLWVSFEQWLPAKARQLGMAVDVNALGPGTLSLAFICSLLPVLVLMYGLWRLRQLFGLYRHGCFFAEANAGHLLAFARALVISALLSPVVTAVLSVILTWHNPPGYRALALHFGSGQFATLFVAGVFMIIAWIMREAKKLADDNAEII